MRDPYECLAVPRTATADEIARSFRQLAKQLHPDVNTDPKAAARFAELSVAHDILSDAQKRRAFDRREIDAEGKPALLPGRTRSRFWRGVTVTAAALILAATSTVIVQHPERAASAKAGSVEPPDGEDHAGAARRKTPDADTSEFRLVLQQNDSYATDNTIPLGLQVSGEAEGLSLVISGLPSGSTLSGAHSGEGGQWRILAADVGNAMIRLPQGFHGPLDFVAELRLADDTPVDSGSFRLEVTPAVATAPVQAAKDSGNAPPDQVMASAPPTAQEPPQRAAEIGREQVELLIGRSQTLMAQGDIGAARTLLQRAAENQDARAALALGATFDPIMLAIVQARGVTADIPSALYWYKKASDLGSAEAQQRMQLLTSDGAAGAPATVARVAVSRNPEPETTAKSAAIGQPKHQRPLAHQRSNEPPPTASHNGPSEVDPSGVYVAGARVGSDPDPNIRAQLLRDDAGRELRTDATGRQLLADPARTATGSPSSQAHE
jgi:hypothetical protein